MKKIILTILAIMMIAPTFIFAQGEKEEENVTIEFWTHEDANRQAIEDQYIADFVAANPDVTVNATRQSSKKMIELVQTAFAANEGPTIFNLESHNANPFVLAQRVAPVNYKALGYKDAADLKAHYIDGMLDPVTYNGEIYGIPFEGLSWCLYINKNVFKDAGLNPDTDYPKTWEEMVTVSEKLVKRNGNIIERRGFDFRYPYYLEVLVPMVEQLGGDLFSADGKEAIVGEEAWVKVLDYMQQWGPNGLNLGSPTYTNARKLFNSNNNDIAMCLSGLYQEARIKYDNPDFYNSGEWMVVPFPTFENAVRDVSASFYGQFYMVNADASKKTQDKAWELIGSMLSNEKAYLTEVNLIPPTKTLMSSEEFVNMPYADVFIGDIDRAHHLYFGKNSTEIQSLLSTAVSNVMLQDVSPEQAYQNLKASVQELIDEE
ncbi:MAG: extracellular solute-binding protein [Spirochaetia bacterium]|nr:extracellular solute-binding protein [Spirochaetia bacterium]